MSKDRFFQLSETLRAGDILHCTGTRIISKAIRLFTKSKYSHTAVVVETWGALYVVDAQRNGVNPRPLKEWLEEYSYKIEVSRPSEFFFPIKELSIKAFSKVGFTEYDLASLFFYQPVYLFTGKWKGRDHADAEGRMYCSEFVAWLFEMPNYWIMTPKDVYQYCVDNGKFKFVVVE